MNQREDYNRPLLRVYENCAKRIVDTIIRHKLPSHLTKEQQIHLYWHYMNIRNKLIEIGEEVEERAEKIIDSIRNSSVRDSMSSWERIK